MLQEFAKNAKENNQDRGTPEKWETFLNNRLTTEYAARLGDLPTATGNSTKYTSDLLERYQRARAFARALPTMFPEEEIMGAEVRVEPRLGTKFTKPGEPVTSEGFIDLQTRNKAGELINYEMKPNLSYGNLWDQLLLYNPQRNARWARALSYGDTTDYSDRSKFIQEREYKEADMQNKESRMQRLHDVGVLRYAETGFNPLKMAETFMPFTVDRNGSYVFGQPSGESVAATAAVTGALMRNMSEELVKGVKFAQKER